MSQEYLITEKSDLTAIADAIREKSGEQRQYYITELAAAISGVGVLILPMPLLLQQIFYKVKPHM